MPSPQTEYSFDDLERYLDSSEVALANFEKRYPDLSFEYRNPELIVNLILKDFADNVNQEWVDKNAYLEEFEQDAVPIGSVVRHDHHKQMEKCHRELSLAVKAFAKDLEQVYKLNLVNITGILMRMQMLSTKFTAERIDKHEWHKEWVAKQRYYYELYQLEACRKFRETKSLDLKYVDSPDDLPETSGMYFLLYRGEIVYIGHSSNLRKRIKNHKIVREYYFKNSDGMYNINCVYVELPVEEAKSIERNLIYISKPRSNEQGKPHDI
jgi:predicted GIY-YIG superfamily endonuclease